ncbi:hypothetical protein BH11VER1_BH11VER1_14590 [soil metagenome]
MKRFIAFLLLLCSTHLQASIEGALEKLDAVGHEGQGNEAASVAWKEVVKAGPSALLPLLSATGKGNVVADNWLRLAANVIADQAVQSKTALPLAEMEVFLKDTQKESSARLLAFDLIQQADASKADAIEPGLLNDPSQDLRRGAVQRLIVAGAAQVEQKQFNDAKATYGKALDAARDGDQVKVIAEALTKQGVEVDLPKHFGFLMNWQVIGPFENTKRAGFDAVFAPEKEFKADATYEGKGAQVKWQPFVSKHEYGEIDFNKPLGMLKETTAYAQTTFQSAEARDAEIRLGSKNAWKVWLNGELLFGRDEYHRGRQMDQYKLKCKLKKGANTILVKCCQNEQTETWTTEWEFQLRVCDATGTAIKEG